MHGNLMNDKEFGSLKLLKLKYRMGYQMIQTFFRIGSPQEIRFPVFNLYKFQKFENGIPESCRLHWNLMNEEEFGSLKLLKLKDRRGGSNNSDFLQNWFSPKIWSPLFNLWKFEKSQKVLHNHVEYIEI